MIVKKSINSAGLFSVVSPRMTNRKWKTLHYNMNRNRMNPARSHQSGVYERLSQRLDELAEREGHYDNSAKIAAMRKAHFADVDELIKSGRIIIPK